MDLYRHHRQRAGLSPTEVGLVLAAATVFGIIGAGGAALRGTQRPDRLAVWLGYALLIASVLLLTGHPLLVRYAIAALLFKFTDFRAAFYPRSRGRAR